MSRVAAWSRAYARQAEADWQAYERLVPDDDVPRSESLHLLQMAVEKLVKAHLYLARPDAGYLQTTHAVIAKNLPPIFTSIYARQQRGKKPSGTLLKYVRRVARELDCLHPSNMNGGNRRDNCEYPWEDAEGQVHVPAEHLFEEIGAATRERWWLRLVEILKTEMSRLAET